MANSFAATPPALLTQFPEAAKGSGANALDFPRSVGVDPVTGHVFVGEDTNHRISEFDPWGVFVRAWGWGVEDGSTALQTCGPPEPEVAPSPALCRAGISGAGAGQINSANGLALDANGNLYVFERNNIRVQKFSSSGQFELMFGGEVNKTTGEDVCTQGDLEAGEVCGIGVEGADAGSFSKAPSLDGDYIAIASDGTVYVGDKGRIQLFEPNGTFQGQLPVPDEEFVGGLAIDRPTGDLLLSLLITGSPGTNPSIFRLSPTTGDVTDTIDIEAPELGKIEALAATSDGNLFVNFGPNSNEPPRILEFAPDGRPLLTYEDAFGLLPGGAGDNPRLFALDSNSVGDLYVGRANGLGPGDPESVSAVAAYGPPPIAIAPPPLIAPTIREQFAATVGTTNATLKATINPHFWDDTRYFVEVGTDDCDLSPCQKQPAPPGVRLTDRIVNGALPTQGVSLSGLSPNTTYRYRFIAESTGGGPVVADERTFTTAVRPPQQPACPGNQAFRPGAAAFLPDCRAYEMVSPVDKNGADISVVFNSLGDPAGLDQASTSGDALTYSAFRAFGNVESSPYTSQYLARRTSTGWAGDGISPPRRGPSIYAGGPGLDSQYKGFSPDLCSGWLLQDSDLSLAEGSVAGSPNFYRRDNCAGGFSTLAPFVPPTLKEAKEFRPELQGFSADGSQTIFVAPGKLTNNASVASQLYEVSPIGMRLVCILPNKTALKTACSAGTGNGLGAHPDRSASVSNAFSDDGTAIYWTEGTDQGRLFVRVNRTDTFVVSEGSAQFWTASADGSSALYSVGAQLFQFDLASKTSTPIASGFRGLLGASDDASTVYFASTQDLDDGAIAGEPNLYLRTAGDPSTVKFIATLSESDVTATNTIPSSVATWPIRHVSRVTPDGTAVAFMSNAGLTGVDNVDAASGQADAAVFLYRAGTDTLMCVSCSPTGARSTGRDLKAQDKLSVSFWAAAQLPSGQNQMSLPRVLSDDGNRVYFESFDALSLRDTNSQQDVYEWEAVGAGNCTEAAPGFSATLEGCVNLISSGESPQPSELIDSSADGRDVFFKTASSLLPQDPGLIDIYDARADGGFPLPEQPPAPCLGEACQNPAPPPNDPTPSSQSFVGPGDERAGCPKGKREVTKGGKTRCVKKPKKKQKGKQNKTRRAHR
ncbi:MAG TPA: NHL repeat-containing protein [Solirubrobacterales bacterium]|nr:NHL repeat-containing protein [Solirubrobacterales bacterium]